MGMSFIEHFADFHGLLFAVCPSGISVEAGRGFRLHSRALDESEVGCQMNRKHVALQTTTTCTVSRLL